MSSFILADQKDSNILPENIRNHFIKLFLLVFAICLTADSFAQRFNSVVFKSLPQNYQLYPRNDKNEAAVPISGVVEAAGYSYVSIFVSRNDATIKYIRAAITYDGKGLGSFSAEALIRAELAGYGFKVYACKPADSTLIVTRQKVVSGDAYVIMGQSNSTGFFSETATSEYCRSFGKITGTLNTEPYNPADTLWGISNMPEAANVGTMGLEIQKELSQKNGIPNCLINGGIHWSTAQSHSVRNAGNPADLNTPYGRMLYRVQKAGLGKAVKGFIYRQGETEAYHEGFAWETFFKILHDNVKLDLPSVQKFYVFQIDIIFYQSTTGASLRDYQRRLPDIYPDIRNLATVGTKQFDGLHYGSEGNKQGGVELSRLINRDIYGSKDTVNINSPNVRKVFYKNAEKKELVLVFDEGQDLVYPGEYKPNANVTLNLKDFIYLDDAAGSVVSGIADRNRIIFTLNGPKNATKINYLPPFVAEGGSFYPFNGPKITNKLGMRAFTFFQVAIGNGLEAPALTAQGTTPNVILNWTSVKDATSYLLERRPEGEADWKTIATLPAATKTFTDNLASSASKLNYRIKAMSALAESGEYGNAEVLLVTGLEEEREAMFEAYPNPVRRNETMTIRFRKPLSGIVSVLDKDGRKQSEIKIKAGSQANFSPAQLPLGYYILRLESGDQQSNKKILVAP
jgi:hypothetical protein